MNTDAISKEHAPGADITAAAASVVVEEQDELQRRFNIVPRFIEPELKKAAHAAWVEFCSKPMEPVMFIRLLGVCEGNVTEATVIWDIVCYHRRVGLARWRKPELKHYTVNYGKDFGTIHTFYRRIAVLGQIGLLIHWPVAAQATYKFRLDWVELYERLLEVSDKLPGLVAHPAYPVNTEVV